MKEFDVLDHINVLHDLGDVVGEIAGKMQKAEGPKVVELIVLRDSLRDCQNTLDRLISYMASRDLHGI